MRGWSGRRGVLLAVGVAALVFGPFATYQLTASAPRTAALVLADLAVGWSMIAAGLIICDRRPGNRIGPLAVLTGFAWFAGDFTTSSIALVSYVATVFHGWFDPLFAIIILAYPTGRLLRPIDRGLALGFIVVQGAWSIAKAYGLRPIAWWDCPTCIDTVDSYIAAQQALDAIGRLETAALTALSIGVLSRSRPAGRGHPGQRGGARPRSSWRASSSSSASPVASSSRRSSRPMPAHRPAVSVS